VSQSKNHNLKGDKSTKNLLFLSPGQVVIDAEQRGHFLHCTAFILLSDHTLW